MIFKRCAFIIIYVSLSALNPSSGRAAASNLLDTTVAKDKIIFTQNVVNRENFKSSSEKSNVQIDRQLRQNSAASESFPAIDRRWTLGAMALTASISLFLLWLLFRKPSPDSRAATEVVATDRQSEPSIQNTILQSNIASEVTAPLALDLESNNSLVREKSPLLGSTVTQIDAVRELIQDLQPDLDFGKNGSLQSDLTAQISRRRKAIWELTKIGDYRSIEPLLKIMPQVTEPDKSLIIEAVNRVAHRSFKPIDEQLFTNLQDLDPVVRLNAVRDLKNLYQFVAPAITKLSQMQSDVDYQVRQSAVQALVQLNANPLPTFTNSAKASVEQEINKLVSGQDSEANLHLVAYLLAELDAEK